MSASYRTKRRAVPLLMLAFLAGDPWWRSPFIVNDKPGPSTDTRLLTSRRAIDTDRIITKIRKTREYLRAPLVISRRLFSVLIGSLAVLVVALAVIVPFHLLLRALGDVAAARALLWASVACLMLLLVDLVLLVAALGCKAIQDDDALPRE